MNNSDQYLKIVKWSNEDECYVGTSPGLFYGGCHGADKGEVHAELCQIIDEWLEIFRQDGKPLPPSNNAQDASENIA